MDSELDKKITRYFQDLNLPSEAMASLKADYFKKPKMGYFHRWKKLGLTAAVCIGFIIAGNKLIPTWNNQHDLLNSIAAEISLNHHKFKEPDFFSDKYSILTNKMEKLDFSLFRPQRLGSEIKLVGARYCSIQGDIAAQIRLINNSGRVMTLYQAKETESLKRLNENVTYVDGLEVSIWIENGLFNGLANPSD